MTVEATSWTSAGAHTGCGTRWVTGWVYRVGIPGGCTGRAIPVYYPAAASPPADQRPEGAGPALGRVGRKQGGRPRVSGRRRGRLPEPPCGPGRALRALPVLGPPECRLTAKRARFHAYFYEVSQNGEVSLKSVHKACHSPCSQKRAHKSPLEILRFPIWPAFSHKELMGLF